MNNYIRDLVYGISGSGKTTWWLTMAEAVHQSTGKKTRWYLGDGGGQTINVADMEDFVEVFQYNLWDKPFETTQKMCEGGWPQDVNTPNSKILPTTDDEWKGIGLCVFEGLSVGADYMMGDRQGGLANRMAKGEMLNNDASFKIQDGDLKFGGLARSHYGFTQRRILDIIERTRALPCHVGWTAHERKVDDEEYKETWIGPDVSGKLLTTKIGASFGNTVHLHPVKKIKKGVRDPLTEKIIDAIVIDRRAYTRTHFDPEAGHFVKYYANTRFPPGTPVEDYMPEFIEPNPIEYYKVLARARAEAKKNRPSVVGLQL